MPAPVLAANDILIGVVKGVLYNQTVESTFHWKITSVPNGYNLSNFVDDMMTGLLPEYALCLSASWTASACYARRVSSPATRGVEKIPVVTPGAIASLALPPSNAAVLSRYTNASGPKGRGRVFMPAVPTSFHLNGLLTSAAVDVYAGFLPWLDVTWTTGGAAVMEPVLVNLVGLATNIENAKVQRVLRVQRRREVGVGI
jgi:hypothetical protein